MKYRVYKREYYLTIDTIEPVEMYIVWGLHARTGRPEIASIATCKKALRDTVAVMKQKILHGEYADYRIEPTLANHDFGLSQKIPYKINKIEDVI